jgi:hypothetical protein
MKISFLRRREEVTRALIDVFSADSLITASRLDEREIGRSSCNTCDGSG